MSFYHAISGILSALKKEVHLRFHLLIAILIMIFAYFYGISAAEWAILILDIAAVFSSELLNTAVEKAVDTATHELMPTAKLSKDAAAGAVLVLATASLLVGICLFGNIERIKNVLIYIFTSPEILLPCLLVGILGVLYVIFGGEHDR